MKKTVPLLCALCALQPTAVWAQNSSDSDRPRVRAVRLTGPVEIDGRLDEAAWADAPIVSGFTQVDPEEGRPVSERTEARVLFDSEALYIGVRLYDREPVSTRLGRRDMPLLDSDWLGVVIDSYHDHRTGFSFDVNPSGVQRDAIKSVGANGRESDDNSWDPVWDAATTIDDGGWTAEYRIPFSQLRFTSTEAPTWGVQLERVIGRRKEYAVLSFTPKIERGGVPTYGHLVGLRELKPAQRLEVLPYVVTRAEYVDPRGNPFRTDSEYFGSGGVDLLFRASSQFTVNATINPDFGQVEVDPAVINLSVYETFFQEKRPFFVEGNEIFDFGRNTSGGQLFYSRRIGRRPQGRAPSGRSDQPDATTILGAGKLSGKTEGGWSVGILEAVTAEERARYLSDGDNLPGSALVEPLTNYVVGRIRKDGRSGRSSVGGMVTLVNRRLGGESLAGSLRESAYAGGIDFREEWANRTWVLQGSAVASRVAGDPGAIVRTQTAGNHFFQRPDADHLEVTPKATSMTGYSVGVSLAKQAGTHWTGSLALAATSPQFEVNDLGFQTRTDRRDVALNVNYQETRPGSFFRAYGFGSSVRYEHNFSNQRILNFWNLGGHLQHLNWWSVAFNLNHMSRALDDRSTRGGPLMERPSSSSGFIGFFSDPRKSVTYSVSATGSRDRYDGWRWGGGFNIGLKTSPRWNLSVGPNFNRSFTNAQYVGTVDNPASTATFGADYLFAPLRQTTLSMVTRFDFTFTPKLSVQLYAQPFISSGDYGDTGALAAPQSYRFTPWSGDAPDLDFNFRSLRGTAVMRWEWKAGSTLYLAWQQVRSDFARGVGDFDFGRDQRALFSADPDNVFVLKMNYWITP
jgi:Domain of unknown function (DUF5916)/Carbohydrate family 9 binding domain-like